MTTANEFSFGTRATSLRKFKEEVFDLLIIGGGITGAAVARDAVSRGLKVALVERNDFAFGTSSRSSKLIHGGLRYLENLEFALVFEALAERAFLLKTIPHMVRPLPFFWPVYRGDAHGKGILDLGLWLYDLLALFRAPGFHKRLSRKAMMEKVPFLDPQGLQGGFSYFDASMWDDVLAVETLRAASTGGAAIANYTEAVSPRWDGERITGFRLRDREKPLGQGEVDVRCKRVVVCAGPWTDHVARTMTPNWRGWLNPSKGVHLVFDLKRIPIPGAMVMSHPQDGRISFVIPRPDMGAGVVIVGTTDGPTPNEPEKADIEPSDVEYLLGLLTRYFPNLKLQSSDILSAYVGVRPLMGAVASTSGSEGQSGTNPSLQKVSREHHIGVGPGGAILVAGGKYTTHRRMAQEIVDFTLKEWKRETKERESKAQSFEPVPPSVGPSNTENPVNRAATPDAIEQARAHIFQRGIDVPEALIQRYGAEALEILEVNAAHPQRGEIADPDGFPFLAAQLRYCMRTGLVVHLEDFYLRRLPLFSSRADHGLPWAEMLSQVWAEERGLGDAEARRELGELKAEIDRRNSWKKRLVEKREELPVT